MTSRRGRSGQGGSTRWGCGGGALLLPCADVLAACVRAYVRACVLATRKGCSLMMQRATVAMRCPAHQACAAE